MSALSHWERVARQRRVRAARPTILQIYEIVACPHPALRATFSRREKDSSLQFVISDFTHFRFGCGLLPWLGPADSTWLLAARAAVRLASAVVLGWSKPVFCVFVGGLADAFSEAWNSMRQKTACDVRQSRTRVTAATPLRTESQDPGPVCCEQMS